MLNGKNLKRKLDNIFTGYTELEGNGYWRNSHGKSFYQKSYIIVYIHQDNATEDSLIDSTIMIIKEDFDQQSVLRVDQIVKARF